MPEQDRDTQIFMAADVRLEGVNLIEASAGTGKTYSIALLVLRLILEENMPIEKILLVTFTRDAAAEMKLRVRLFIQKALSVAKARAAGAEADTKMDEAIVKTVDRVRPADAIDRLNTALLTFDKAAMFTIHGFCSRILKEYAFETDRIFDAQTMHPSEFNTLLEEVFNQGWRDEVTTLDAIILNPLLANGLTREKMYNLVKEALSGKIIYLGSRQLQDPQEIKGDLIQNMMRCLQPYQDRLDVLKANVQEKEEALTSHVDANRADWLAQTESANNTIKTGIPKLLDDATGKLIKVFTIKTPQYGYEFFKDDKVLEDCITQYEKAVTDLNSLTKKIKENKDALERDAKMMCSVLAKIIYSRVAQQLNRLKQQEGFTTYDDMIEDLHRTVCYNGTEAARMTRTESLIRTLQSRYGAVFIDEFQDTDRQQYEIFSTLFHADPALVQHVVFYIGDPKQSIYAFRKADLETYFRARSQSQNHVMNTNFRSSDKYIAAMNDFFNPSGNFDTFKSDQMRYYNVDAPTPPRTGGIFYQGKALAPLRIMYCQKKTAVFRQTRNLLKHLLYNPDFTFSEERKNIKPSQIGILVRTTSEGRKLRKILAASGIMAVTLSDEKIFQSPQATELLYILEAVENINRGNIYRAMMTTTAGFSWGEVRTLNTEALFQKFRAYMEIWKNGGVYVFLRHFLQDTAVVKRSVRGDLPNAERLLSDQFQLMEILHDAETDKHYMPHELIEWFKKAIEGEAQSEDEYIQRIESDEEAVKIITIHRAKGLEYDIVIAPFLDMKYSTYHDNKQFSKKEQYYVADRKLLESDAEQITKNQEDQENLRLLYVALTRARYHCYVFRNCAEKGTVALKYILDAFQQEQTASSDIRLLAPEDLNDDITGNVHYEADAPEWADAPKKSAGATEGDEREEMQDTPIPVVDIPDRHWQKTSYSGLNPKHDIMIRVKTEAGDNEYDQFVFRQIRSGAQAGNFLHELLERIDFSDDTRWAAKIGSLIKRYPGIIRTDNPEHKIMQLIHHAVHTALSDGAKTFMLNEVIFSSRIQEMEFDMPLTEVNLAQFPESLEGGKIPLRIRKEGGLTGILNGKIDLFFAHGGRYYLLDWKSNHLGNQPEAYHAEAVASAMEEHNYYLQYYLYCLAAYRYLKQRLPGFDYAQHFGGVYYLFLRGMRTGTSYGIYHHRPLEEDLIRLEALLLLPAYS
jgi:exodeoxyribonuclease V beta subunit